ncbi:MAG TPA: DUF58 domain-containing protein [Candidatus Thermoplasmatota archaeon]|nr:DUF58 domain-containing protein [Candidatus Thermoplasmatota archaeon]
MRLTLKGRAAAGALLASAFAALALGSPSFAVATLGIAAAFAFAAATLRAPALLGLRELPRDRFVEGEAFEERLTIRGRRSTRAILVPRGGAALAGPMSEIPFRLREGATTLTLGWRARVWGPSDLGPHALAHRDVFGLFERRVEIAPRIDVRVRPVPASLGRHRASARNPEPALGAHSVARPGDGMEFFALREYRAGDSVRRINWKASARAGETIVNQVTRESYARVVVFLDLRAKEDLGPAETSARARSGRAAAGILAHHERAKDHLTLVLVKEEARRASLAANPRLGELLDALGACASGGAGLLEAAVRSHLGAIRRNSPVYFVTSGVADPSLARALAVARDLGSNPTLVAPEPPLRALQAGPELLATRTRALERLRAEGFEIVDWKLGEDLEAALLAR